jgi:hypothetical protein
MTMNGQAHNKFSSFEGFILFYFILFYFILFYFILFSMHVSCDQVHEAQSFLRCQQFLS